MKNSSFQEGGNSSRVGTQTEQTKQKKLKEYQSKYNDIKIHGFKHSDEDCEVISDEMSVCGSLGAVLYSC